MHDNVPILCGYDILYSYFASTEKRAATPMNIQTQLIRPKYRFLQSEHKRPALTILTYVFPFLIVHRSIANRIVIDCFVPSIYKLPRYQRSLIQASSDVLHFTLSAPHLSKDSSLCNYLHTAQTSYSYFVPSQNHTLYYLTSLITIDLPFETSSPF